jgi:tartrate-resistant acid phosphatase type 5
MKATTIALMLGCVVTLVVGASATTHAATRIVALGDTGTGDCNQYKVARALKRWCDMKKGPNGEPGCDYALLLGDNFYEKGLSGQCSRDPQTGQVRPDEFRRAFIDPYGPAERLKPGQTLAGCLMPERHDLNFWFGGVLGNHDYSRKNAGADPFNWNHAALQWDNEDEDVPINACSDVSLSEPKGGKWFLPYPSYSYASEDGSTLFLALDTTSMVAEQWELWNGTEYVATPLRTTDFVELHNSYFIDLMDQSSAWWKIAFGHHPYVSNGPHGNAGTYDGGKYKDADGKEHACPTDQDAEGGWACGLRMKNFIKDLCAHGLDLYLSGHDHSLQWLYSKCDRDHPDRDVEFIVSGAGAKTTNLPGTGTNLQRFGAQERLGFVYLVIDGQNLEVTVVSASNPENPGCRSKRTLTKTAPGGPVTVGLEACQ